MLDTIGKFLLGIFFQQLTVQNKDGSFTETTVWQFSIGHLAVVGAALAAATASALNVDLGEETTIIDVTGFGSAQPKVVIHG